MITGKTKSGFEYEISEKRLNNYELVEVLAEVDENPLLLPKTLIMLLGKEQTEKLKNHLRDEEGFVDTDKISEEMVEIFQNQAETKNS